MSDRHSTKPYSLRISDELRGQLEQAAHASGRSLNAEIVSRLQSSLQSEAKQASAELSFNLEMAIDALKEYAERHHVTPDEALAAICSAAVLESKYPIAFVVTTPGMKFSEVRAAMLEAKKIFPSDAYILAGMREKRRA